MSRNCSEGRRKRRSRQVEYLCLSCAVFIGILSQSKNNVHSFINHVPLCHSLIGHSRQPLVMKAIPSNNNGNSENNNYRSDIDAMRRILEQSWDSSKMGDVPTSASSAASAAAKSLNVAMSDSSSEKNTFMVDINLPSLDVTMGPNIYDDVAAVEFCIELAKNLKQISQSGKGIAIIVNDGNTVQRVQRILNVRKREVEDNRINAFDVSDLEEEEDFYDDFQDFGEIGMSNTSLSIPNDFDEYYRLGSIVGDVQISTGPNMLTEIVQSVGTNAITPKQAKEEDVIIILSPSSQVEMVGLRSLVNTYGESKTIVIVNSKLDPIPREIISSKVVYSMLPLIARSVESSNKTPKKPTSPKIVLIRRYPKDWEIYCDTNDTKGFELAASVSASDVGMKGPSMEWIANCVKNHMQVKYKPGN